MKHGTRWIALSMLVIAYGRSASPQVRTRVRAPTITALRPSMSAIAVVAPSPLACSDPGVQTCGLGVCAVTVARCQNSRAVACAPDMNRRVPETCDGLDNDCDGVVDNAPASRVARSACPSAVACEAVRAVALTAGVTDWRLAPASGRTCAPPFAAGASSHELHVVTVAARTAVALSTAQGGLSLFAPNGAPALVTVDGLCAPGTRTGAAILEPGTYVLRATGDGAGARSVHVEAVVVPARAAAPVTAASARVTMSTATAEEAPFDCRASEGVDVRVLVCPRGASAVLSSPRGFLASVEGAAGGRTCYPVSSQRAHTAPLPAGSLAVVRAWPSGAERGPAFVDFL